MKKPKQKLQQKCNPFEVHINKQKMTVLGRKTKNDRGLPGVARAKALDKRKKTLLQEYKHRHKSNQFLDKRIGENNKHLNEDERVMARFAAIRMKNNKRKSIFNLADDEVLTHKGQSLAEIEKHEDPRSDDDDDEADRDDKNLNADFVEDAHFGGGLLQKTNRSHKDLINELIAESKRRKAEKQKIKEATLELTEKLDTEWKDLMPLVGQSKKTEENTTIKADDYDRIMRELKFEKRGTVSDRLKTDEEKAEDERQKMEEAEAERLARMRDENATKSKHRSADDLEDDLVYNSEEEQMISYDQDGKSNVEIDYTIEKVPNEEGQESEEESSAGSESESNEDESEENEDELEKNEAESEDNEAESEENEDEIEENIKIIETPKVSDKISYPKTYEDFQKIFDNHPIETKTVLITKLMEICNKDREKSGVIFVYLLQHLNDISTNTGCFEILDKLLPKLSEIAQMNYKNTHDSLKEIIKEKFDEYRKRPKNFPGFDILIFLRLVGVLFSTSDFRHQIVTPCFTFIESMLRKCRVKSRKDISYGLFLVTMILDFTVLSRRYLPATINFLAGLLCMAIPKSVVKIIKNRPQFKLPAGTLILRKRHSNDPEFPTKMTQTDLLDDQEIDDDFRLRVMSTTIGLLNEFDDYFKDYPSNPEIFDQCYDYLRQISTDLYPKFICKEFQDILGKFEKNVNERKLEYLVMATKKPKALRLYQPRIEEVYDVKPHRKQSRDKTERDKLMYKLKMEKKGALREIRRDKDFLGRVKVKRRIQSDKERHEKVKRIYAEASQQLGKKAFD